MNPLQFAENACQRCRSQKQKCDRRMPRCSRCLRKDSECDYQLPFESTPCFLFTRPSTAGELFVPGAFPMDSVDIDRFTVGLVITALAEQGQPVEAVLDEYFTYIHAWLATIHEPRFRSRVRSLLHTPHAETALTILVMSLLTVKGHDECSRECARSAVYPLASHLFSHLQFVRGSSLELVQAGLLLAVYETGAARSEAAFITIGTCARLGYILQLNVDIEATWVIAEERRRVWLGIYVMDRLIHQLTKITAPAVDDPSHDFKLPIDDQQWQNHTIPPPGPFQPSFSTPADIPQSYFAREIQASRILSEVQSLSSLQQSESDSVHDKMGRTEALHMDFMKHLLHQTPESWKVMCGANAIAMLTSLTLHRKRLVSVPKQSHPLTRSSTQHQSILALTSTINMVRDTCVKFDARSQKEKLPILPLPATICVGEAAQIAMWLSGDFVDAPHIDIEPLRRILVYAAPVWSLAGGYLRDLVSTGS